ncbi:PucR family transcriptional regulator ligand-binding domain-containing protein [Brevibacterium sediminis]|uniref:PucR family transcriptional regulator n=1 Tax=Brevibacterium sediminis TaxID=1857024 RepID=UPI0021751FDC|nr:PucR family transcriptional regulator [Brevibacterium sediminis]MCS4594658.1 PucR family transcriptional regulator ligand-binding domain-containing protein [Brevibacterium sediminis]
MISVDDLAALPTMGLEFVAGQAGGHRMVTWAHVCDLDDPWNWVGSGDLVMTTGPGIPKAPADQVEWLDKIVDAGVSALVLALGPKSPAASEQMLEAATARKFPVLTGRFDLQFVTLARAVIESSIDAERRRIAAIRRLYDVNSMEVETGQSIGNRLSALEKISGWALCLWDGREDTVLFAGRHAERAGLSDAPDTAAEAIALPGDPHLRLVASPLADALPDKPLLAHVVGLLTMEFRYRGAEQDRLRQSGQELFSGLLAETITPSAVWPELNRRGLTEAVVIACWRSTSEAEPADGDVHRRTWLDGLAPLLFRQGSQLLGVVPDDVDLLHRIAEAVGPDVVTGVSSTLTSNSSFPEVVRQAKLAGSRAVELQSPVVRYDDDQTVSMFPATPAEVRNLVRGILGPVIDYDRANSTDLVASVRVFLGNDGNWSRSAEQLTIHRQTLVYRMNKVTELIGFAPASSRGTALLWLAIESARRTGIDLADIVAD